MTEQKARCMLCGEPMPAGEEMFKFHGHSGPCPKPRLPKVQSGIEIIAAERQRQIQEEGWSAEHDDYSHTQDTLAMAATRYCLPPGLRSRQIGALLALLWPWAPDWWKPSPDNRIRELAKAGALIAAEIDRRQRESKKS